jgi:hypothetical protein
MSYGRFNEKQFRELTREYSRAKDETVCGRGSTMENTEAIRSKLPEWFRKYEIKSLNDAGSGDRHWSKHLDLEGIQYQGYDLKPRYDGVIQCDITSEVLPLSDAILCRHVLNHLTSQMVNQAISNFIRSTTYLIANTYDKTKPKPAPFGIWSQWDLKERLGDPLESMPDVEGELAIWRLK